MMTTRINGRVHTINLLAGACWAAAGYFIGYSNARDQAVVEVVRLRVDANADVHQAREETIRLAGELRAIIQRYDRAPSAPAEAPKIPAAN